MDNDKKPTGSQPVPTPTSTTKTSAESEKILKLENELAELKKMLVSVTDKHKLDAFNDKQRDRNVKTIHISKYDDKFVVSWSNLSVNKRIKKDGQFVGDHQTTLTFLDGSTKDIDYCEWQKDKVLVEAIVESETKDKFGDITYQAITKDGDKVEINSRFIN